MAMVSFSRRVKNPPITSLHVYIFSLLKEEFVVFSLGASMASLISLLLGYYGICETSLTHSLHNCHTFLWTYYKVFFCCKIYQVASDLTFRLTKKYLFKFFSCLPEPKDFKESMYSICYEHDCLHFYPWGYRVWNPTQRDSLTIFFWPTWGTDQQIKLFIILVKA